jgi:tRNA dimethylallyltransferase
LEPETKNTLLIICGPTASGKTEVSIEIAKAFNSEIISADSKQFYRELKIGVAAPTPDQLNRIRHHFVGHLSIADNYNVSRFEKDVIAFLDDYFVKNNIALMVGGSGLYIDAVSKGIDDLPDSDEKVRNRLRKTFETKGLEPLKSQLKELDPDYYEVVDLNNPNRIMRALEVCIAAGKPFSSLRSSVNRTRDFRVIKIGLDRPRKELFERIEKRVEQMIVDGLVEEVKILSPFKNLNSLNTVGYKEIFRYLEGDWSIDEAVTKIKTNTRRYAKRQLTWFKKDKSVHWFHPDELEKIIDFIKIQLNKDRN